MSAAHLATISRFVVIGTWSENSPSGNGASYSPRYNKLRPIAFKAVAEMTFDVELYFVKTFMRWKSLNGASHEYEQVIHAFT
jgi:hypothetical protein